MVVSRGVITLSLNCQQNKTKWLQHALNPPQLKSMKQNYYNTSTISFTSQEMKAKVTRLPQVDLLNHKANITYL